MATGRARFGLTLPNRGVIIGATTVAEMLEMAEWADTGGWDSVWVGDSIFAKPRLDAIGAAGRARGAHQARAPRPPHASRARRCAMR